ncbi:hypothetical protein PAMA_008744 [Pampus argenteus]
MSTSDAGELQLRAGGGERATTLYGTAAQAARTSTAREENRETLTWQHFHQSAIRQKGAHKALTFLPRKEEAVHRGDSNIQTQKPFGPRFTSRLFLRFSRNLSLDKPELRPKKKPDTRLHGLTEPQRIDTENSSSQVNGQTSPPGTPIDVASDSPLPEQIPFLAKREEDVITVVSNGLEATRDRELEEYIKDYTKLKNQTDFEGPSDPNITMLSSTVTVLAPQWSGGLRRTKRFEDLGSGNLQAYGGLQDVTNRAQKRFREPQNQHGVERMFTDGSHTQSRVPFLGNRRNTVAWSTKNDNTDLDYERKRKVVQSASLDVNSGMMNNRRRDAGASLDPNEQNRNLQTTNNHQGGHPTVSSKPTTSSLLLSMRRFNSNSRNSHPTPTLSEIKSSPLSSSPKDRDGKLFTPHISQNFFNKNEQERVQSLHSTSSISYRTTTETGPIFSPSYSSYRERDASKACLYSSSPMNKVTQDVPFTQQPQTINKTRFSPSASRQEFLSGGQSERQQNWRATDKGTETLLRHYPYDSSVLLKTHSNPGRTTMSSSWREHSTLECGSPPLNGTTNIINKPNTLFGPPCNDNSDFTSPSPTDTKRFSSQIHNNRDNGTTESVFNGNMGGTHNLNLDHKSDRFLKQQSGLHPQFPHSLPDFLSSSRISRPTGQMKLCRSKDLGMYDMSGSSFTLNATELPPTELNPQSTPTTPTASSSIYTNNHCSPKTNNNPVSTHNKDSQKFTKQSLPPETTNTLSSQANTSKIVHGLPLTQSIQTSPSFQSLPVHSQTNMQNASSHTCSSSQMAKFTATISSPGFERSYASISKPKPASSFIPTVSTLSKTNNSLVSTISHPEVTTIPSASLHTPHVAPAITFSPKAINTFPLSPAPTPSITSPIYSGTSSPKEEKTLSNSLEKDPKKLRTQAEGRRTRHVTWEDSVDLQHSEPVSVKKPDASQAPTSSLSPQSIMAPSISSFLRSSSPTTNTSHLLQTSNTEVGRGEKYRSLSTDCDLASREKERTKQRPSDTMIFDQERRESSAPRQERTLSVESGKAQYDFPAPLSLPPDFSSRYIHHYSSPPYSALMSARSPQPETKNITPRSPLHQQPSQSHYDPHPFLRTDPVADMKMPLSELTPSPINSHQRLCLPGVESSMRSMDQVSKDLCKNISQDLHNGQLLFLNNRVHISSKSLQGDEATTCVTQTVVYSITSNVDTASSNNTRPESLQHTADTLVSMETTHTTLMAQSKRAAGDARNHSNQSFGVSNSANSLDDEHCNRIMKESRMSKGRFLTEESNNEQSLKRSRFVLKKNISTSNSRSDSEKADVLFPWKWKQPSQTPVSESRDISNSNKELEEQKQETEMVLQDSEKGTEDNRWTQQKYTVIPSLTIGNTMAEDAIWSDNSTPQMNQEQNACAEHTLESKTQAHSTMHSPPHHPVGLNTDDRADYKQHTTSQFLSCSDPSPVRNSNPSHDHPAQFRKSTSSPRSPFSPFSSLFPLSSCSSSEVMDDSVFYSPKLQRHRESYSPREPGEGISLVGSRRSQASTGPSSANSGPDKDHLSSSYADLKYGIEPGRSFSVSSVHSNRTSGPGRIATGSRFMSVGDLTESALDYSETGKDLDRDWSTEYDCTPDSDCQMSYFSGDPGKMRSRSLPRSLTRCSGNWSSDVIASSPVTGTTTKPAHLWSPNMNSCHFAWDTEGPLTPPPTPPLSPVSRRISNPPSLSSPVVPLSSSSGTPKDSQSSRGHLPSRGYISNLSTFEEFSDNSSDTTTDDEYYLETSEDEEKETEL